MDQAALRAAKACGLATGGHAPLGWKTEDGPAPWLGEVYGLAEHPADDYPSRTHANVRDSDGTLWIGAGDSRGFGCTMNGCRKAGNKPAFKVMTRGVRPEAVAAWIAENGIRALNVAGNRESSSPGIGQRAEAFLLEVFRLVKEGSP